MLRMQKEQLTKRDVYVTDVTLGDQIHRLNYAVVATKMPHDVLLILVRDAGETELWLRGPKASIEQARYFIAGWRECLRQASADRDLPETDAEFILSLRQVEEHPRVRLAGKKAARKKAARKKKA